MGKELLTFGDIEVEKTKFYWLLFFLEDIDIDIKY